MNPSLLDFYPKFLLSEKTGSEKTPKEQVWDVTEYPTATVDTANVAGVVEYAKRQNVQYYANTDYDTPDVTLDPASNIKFDMPLDSNNDVLYGAYTTKYSVRIKNEIILVDGATTAPLGTTFDSLLYEGAVIADFIALVNAAVSDANLFTIQFLNNSGTVLGSSTVTGAENVGGDLVVSFDEVTLAAFAQITKMRFLTYYSVTKEVSYCAQSWPTGVLAVTGDCIKAQISVQDQTQYLASDIVDRTIDFNYPVLADGTPVESPVTTTNASLLVGPNVWTGAYTIALTSELTRTQTDSLVLVYDVINYNYFTLECDAGLCCMKSCIQGIFAKYQEATQGGGPQLQQLQTNMMNIMGMLWLYTISIECGNTTDAQTWLTNLDNYLNSIGCDCGCSGSTTGNPEPTIVYPLFSDPQPNYVPISYLQSNNITIDSNTKVPTNKAVITYIASLLADYYTASECDALFVILFDTTSVASGTSPVTLNAKSGTVTITSPDAPLPSGSFTTYEVRNTNCVAGGMVVAQISAQAGYPSSCMQIVNVNCEANKFTVLAKNIGAGNMDDTIDIQFLVVN